MATINTSDNPNSSNTGIIILAVIIIAALAVAAIYYMQGGPATTSTDTYTERNVTTIKQVPAPAGNAVSSAANAAADNVANPPTQDAQPVPEPAPAPVNGQ